MSRREVFALDLVDDAALIAAYEERHAPDAVWAEVVRDIAGRGVEAMEIWRVANRMVMIAEVADNYPRPADPSLAPVVVQWEAEMDQYQCPIFANGPKWAAMTRIFSLAEQRA